jgi:hypothetical protein
MRMCWLLWVIWKPLRAICPYLVPSDDGVEWLAEQVQDRPVLFVPGNHDYENATVSHAVEAMRRAAHGTSVRVLWNETFDHDGVRFIGTPLWCDPVRPGQDPQRIMNAISERVGLQYSLDDQGIPITSHWLVEQHRLAKAFIAEELAKDLHLPKVVLTHWAPSLRSQKKDFYFAGTDIEGYWASDCEELVMQAQLWAHGHFHDSVDYRLGNDKHKGRVVSNPRGRTKIFNMAENKAFKRTFIVAIPK